MLCAVANDNRLLAAARMAKDGNSMAGVSWCCSVVLNSMFRRAPSYVHGDASLPAMQGPRTLAWRLVSHGSVSTSFERRFALSYTCNVGVNSQPSC